MNRDSYNLMWRNDGRAQQHEYQQHGAGKRYSEAVVKAMPAMAAEHRLCNAKVFERKMINLMEMKTELAREDGLQQTNMAM